MLNFPTRFMKCLFFLPIHFFSFIYFENLFLGTFRMIAHMIIKVKTIKIWGAIGRHLYDTEVE